MRVYIAHRLTGENLDELRKVLEQVSDVIIDAGHESFIFWRDVENWVPNSLPMSTIYTRCLEEIDKSDMVFVFNHSDKKSEGMLIECGYAKGKNKKFIVAVREGAPQQWLEHLSEKFFKFKDMDDFTSKAKELFFNE